MPYIQESESVSLIINARVNCARECGAAVVWVVVGAWESRTHRLMTFACHASVSFNKGINRDKLEKKCAIFLINGMEREGRNYSVR